MTKQYGLLNTINMNILIKTVLSVCVFSLINIKLSAQDRFNNSPGTTLIGAGWNVGTVGANVKAGKFLKNNFLVGVNGEILHEISLKPNLQIKKEAGLFARKYINTHPLSFYLQGGVAYGRFEDSGDLDFDIENSNIKQTKVYNRLKINASVGAELKLSKRFSLEGEWMQGKILNSPWWTQSIKTSLNYRILK